MTNEHTSSAPKRQPRPLSEMAVGESATLSGDQELRSGDQELLRALGVSDEVSFRVCKTGNPLIVQVRSTRVGMSSAVARRLLVVPSDEEQE